MLSRRLISVQTRLFLLIVVFTWSMALAFFMLQYSRERDYKIASLDAHLQMQNAKILEYLSQNDTLTPQFIATLDPTDSLRVSIIDFKGNVKYDTNPHNVMANHAGRPEVREALRNGHGYTRQRVSSTNDREYFYSATRGNGIVVRTALPYNQSLVEMLRADSVNSYIILAIAIIMTIIAWFAAHRISRTVKNLRDFANKAEFGNLDDYRGKQFPDDELGEISSHIVNLYRIQQETAQERDRNLHEAIRAEREKDRIKRQLTNNMSHELKTPVQVIQGCLETLENNFDDLSEDMRRKLLDQAYGNTRRLSALMADIGTLNRIDEAPDQIGSEQVDVTAAIHRVADEMRLLPQEQQMRIHINVPQGVVITGNQALVESIFRNLMVNAFHYSGGRDVTVSLDEETAHHYKFRFGDNGVGVSAEHLPHLFERFYRVDTGRSRALGGTGLGLAIVKNAVLFHHGQIEVHNRPEGGLEFTFTLAKGS